MGHVIQSGGSGRGWESRRESCLSVGRRMSGGRPGKRRRMESGVGVRDGAEHVWQREQRRGFAESMRGVQRVARCGGAGHTGRRGLSARPLPIWPSSGTFKEFGFYPE